MSAAEEIAELEKSLKDQSHRIEDLREQLRKALYSHKERSLELDEAVSRARFHRNNYVFSKQKADVVNIEEFKEGLASMRSAQDALDTIRSLIGGYASKIKKLRSLIRQVEATIEAIKARLKSYGQVIQFKQVAR